MSVPDALASWIGLILMGCGINLRIWSFHTLGRYFNWASLVVVTVAISCGLVYRITVEERALARDLGGRYQSYTEGRKRLIPFIW